MSGYRKRAWVRIYKSSSGAYTNYDEQAYDDTEADVPTVPSSGGSEDDAVYIGIQEQDTDTLSYEIGLKGGTPNSGIHYVWEYYDSSKGEWIEYNETWTTGGGLASPTRHAALNGNTIQKNTMLAGGIDQTGNNTNTTQTFNGSTWSTGGNMPTSIQGNGGGGTATNGISAGGYTSGYSNATYTYNGTTWSTAATLSTSASNRASSALNGSSAAAVAGGETGASTATDVCETFNGTTWSAWSTFPYSMKNATGGGNSSEMIVVNPHNLTNYTKHTYVNRGSAWSALTSKPLTTEFGSGGGSVYDFIFVEGSTSKTEVFNGNVWKVCNPPLTSYGHKNATCGSGRFIAAGGYDGSTSHNSVSYRVTTKTLIDETEYITGRAYSNSGCILCESPDPTTIDSTTGLWIRSRVLHMETPSEIPWITYIRSLSTNECDNNCARDPYKTTPSFRRAADGFDANYIQTRLWRIVSNNESVVTTINGKLAIRNVLNQVASKPAGLQTVSLYGFNEVISVKITPDDNICDSYLLLERDENNYIKIGPYNYGGVSAKYRIIHCVDGIITEYTSEDALTNEEHTYKIMVLDNIAACYADDEHVYDLPIQKNFAGYRIKLLSTTNASFNDFVETNGIVASDTPKIEFTGKYKERTLIPFDGEIELNASNLKYELVFETDDYSDLFKLFIAFDLGSKSDKNCYVRVYDDSLNSFKSYDTEANGNELGKVYLVPTAAVGLNDCVYIGVPSDRLQSSDTQIRVLIDKYGSTPNTGIHYTWEYYDSESWVEYGETWKTGTAASTATRTKADNGLGTLSTYMCAGGIGSSGSNINTTQVYNGTSWSTGGALPVSAYGNGGGCTSTDGWSINGYTTANINTTYKYNGSTWSTAGNTSSAIRNRSTASYQATSNGAAACGYTTAVSNVCETYSGSAWATWTTFPYASQLGVAGGNKYDMLVINPNRGTKYTKDVYRNTGSAWSYVNKILLVCDQGAGGGQSTNFIHVESNTLNTEVFNGTAWKMTSATPTQYGHKNSSSGSTRLLAMGGHTGSRSHSNMSYRTSMKSISDGTATGIYAFGKSGEIIADKPTLTNVDGTTAYWIRARITYATKIKPTATSVTAIDNNSYDFEDAAGANNVLYVNLYRQISSDYTEQPFDSVAFVAGPAGGTNVTADVANLICYTNTKVELMLKNQPLRTMKIPYKGVILIE